MANITIKQEGAHSEVLIDGQKVRCIAGLSVHMDAKSLLRVILDMAPLAAGLELQDATVAIGNLDAPEAVERALLAHLRAKYEQPAVLGVDLASKPDQMSVTIINRCSEQMDVQALSAVCVGSSGPAYRVGDKVTSGERLIKDRVGASCARSFPPLAGDTTASEDYHRAAIAAGFMTKSEARAAEADPMEAVRAMSKGNR